jgi:hypothetical protein
MIPTAIQLTDSDGAAITVPLEASQGGGYHVTAAVDNQTFTVYVDSVRTARTPAKARWR